LIFQNSSTDQQGVRVGSGLLRFTNRTNYSHSPIYCGFEEKKQKEKISFEKTFWEKLFQKNFRINTENVEKRWLDLKIGQFFGFKKPS
jgi:hypothetical protein